MHVHPKHTNITDCNGIGSHTASTLQSSVLYLRLLLLPVLNILKQKMVFDFSETVFLLMDGPLLAHLQGDGDTHRFPGLETMLL